MKRFITFISFFAIFSVMMCSCSQKNTHSAVFRTVTHVDILTEHDNQLFRRHYQTPEKIRPVLLYLRLLEPYGKPVDVDENADDIYLISIALSDGTHHYYRQASHKYLSKENGPYKTIKPGQAARLYEILLAFPSDQQVKSTY